MNTKISNGYGIAPILLTIFIVLKLIKAIDWSWWWVLSPLWISLAVALAVILWILVLIILKHK